MKLVNYKHWPKVWRFDKNSIYVQEAITKASFYNQNDLVYYFENIIS